MPKHAFVFDCDGTLLDSQGAWDALELELQRKTAYEMSADEKRDLCSFTVQEAAQFFADKGRRSFSVEAIRLFMDDFVIDFLSQHACERPGALSFVRAAACADIPMAVASSSAHVYLEAGLKKAGFLPYLQAVLSVEDLDTTKREPFIYTEAFRLIGAQSFQEKWVFEDSVYALKTLAHTPYRRVGVYATDRAGTYQELSQESDVTVRSWEDLVLCNQFPLS